MRGLESKNLHVVTGAFGYSGRYIAQRLLGSGHRVRTLTNSPQRENPFGGTVEVRPYDFDHPAQLVESLRGAAVLYNTYWVRFDHADFTHSQAVRNTLTLFKAAKQAGVKRVVHVSISNATDPTNLPYFTGKARIEARLKESGMSYAILRPTVLFGTEDILINNIAWLLRRFPVFGVFGDGQYKVQPIFVDDLAALAVEQGRHNRNVTIDAIGPETLTYRELVEEVGRAIGKNRPIVSIHPRLGLLCGQLVGVLLRDVTITWEEIRGLMENRLCTESPPAGATKLSEWLPKHAHDLGRRYSNELARRRDRKSSYESLRQR